MQGMERERERGERGHQRIPPPPNHNMTLTLALVGVLENLRYENGDASRRQMV